MGAHLPRRLCWLSRRPPRRCVCPEPVILTVSGYRAFEVATSQGFGDESVLLGPESGDRCPCRERCPEADAEKRPCGDRGRSRPLGFRGAQPCNALLSYSGLQSCESSHLFLNAPNRAWFCAEGAPDLSGVGAEESEQPPHPVWVLEAGGHHVGAACVEGTGRASAIPWVSVSRILPLRAPATPKLSRVARRNLASTFHCCLGT